MSREFLSTFSSESPRFAGGRALSIQLGIVSYPPSMAGVTYGVVAVVTVLYIL